MSSLDRTNTLIREFHDRGESQMEIAPKVGLSQATIWRRLNPERAKLRAENRRANFIQTTVDGTKKWLRAQKRPLPRGCELCGREDLRLEWHHWSNDFPSLGLWVCLPCHRGVGFIDKGLVEKYLSLKKEIMP